MIEALRAWIVEVESIEPIGGLLKHEYFAVAHDTARSAQEAVREFVGASGQMVVTRAELRSGAVQALELRPGQILPMTRRSGSWADEDNAAAVAKNSS